MIHIFKHGNIVYDETTLTEEEKSQAVIKIKELPKMEKRFGKRAILEFNEETQEVWYEYEDIDITVTMNEFNNRLKHIEELLEQLVNDGERFKFKINPDKNEQEVR